MPLSEHGGDLHKKSRSGITPRGFHKRLPFSGSAATYQ